MCGICGYVTRKSYGAELIEKMNDTMIHRGPNDGGVYHGALDDKTSIAIAQRRLSILDLTVMGHQPMFTEDGQVGIVYNGEIYNFIEIRDELLEKGYHFRSKCDTEVLLYAYQEYGMDFLSRLNGMFAFAVYDKQKEQVIMARDRVGKKPLYYYYNSDVLIFGSELKPVMMHPEFRKNIRNEIVSRYLCQKYIDAPDTIFKDTFKVKPGEYVIWQKGSLFKNQYWDLFQKYKENSANQEEDYQTAKKNLKKLLYDSVEHRLIADVPVGTFLSGGIDSTLITAISRDVQEKQIQTYTIGFETKKENEAAYAKETARYLGTKHTELYISDQELLEHVRGLSKYYDEPFADSSQIPTMLVSRLARQDITVALSGDGGDELFCGYEMYDWVLAAQKLDIFGQIAHNVCNIPGIRKLQLEKNFPDKLSAFVKNRSQDTKVQCFEDIREKHTVDMVLGPSLSAKYDYEKEIKSKNWQIKRMLLDTRAYMSGDILTKVDRASMKYSLEVRCPILDYRIIEYSYSIPHKFKYRKNEKKFILKDILFDIVPKEMLDRPKSGFGVPLADWLRTTLNKELLLFSQKKQLIKQEIFHHEKIAWMIEKLNQSDQSVYSSLLWGFLVFQMWYREYIEDLWN